MLKRILALLSCLIVVNMADVCAMEMPRESVSTAELDDTLANNGALEIAQQCTSQGSVAKILEVIKKFNLSTDQLKDMVVGGVPLLHHAIRQAPIHVVHQLLAWGCNLHDGKLPPIALLAIRMLDVNLIKPSASTAWRLIIKLFLEYKGDFLTVIPESGRTVADDFGHCDDTLPFLENILKIGTESPDAVPDLGRICYEFCCGYVSGDKPRSNRPLKALESFCAQFKTVLCPPMAAVGLLCGIAEGTRQRLNDPQNFHEESALTRILHNLTIDLASTSVVRNGTIQRGERKLRQYGPTNKCLGHYLIEFFLDARNGVSFETLMHVIGHGSEILAPETTDGVAPLDLLIRHVRHDDPSWAINRALDVLSKYPWLTTSAGRNPSKLWDVLTTGIEERLFTPPVQQAFAKFFVFLISMAQASGYETISTTFKHLRSITEQRLLNKDDFLKGNPLLFIRHLLLTSGVNGGLSTKSFFTIFPDKNADIVMTDLEQRPVALAALLPYCSSSKVIAELHPNDALGKNLVAIMCSDRDKAEKADALLDLAIQEKNIDIFFTTLVVHNSFTKKGGQPQQSGTKKGRATKNVAPAKPETALDRGLGCLMQIKDLVLRGQCYALLKYRGANLAVESMCGLTYQESERDYLPTQQIANDSNALVKTLAAWEALRDESLAALAPTPQNKPATQVPSKNQQKKLAAANRRAEEERKQKEKVERELEKKRQEEELAKNVEKERIAREQEAIKKAEEEKRAQEQHIIQERLDQQLDTKKQAAQLQDFLDQYTKLQKKIASLQTYKEALPDDFKKLFEQECSVWKQIEKTAQGNVSVTPLKGSYLGLPCNVMVLELQDQFIGDADRDLELENLRQTIKDGAITYSPTIICRHLLTKSSGRGYFTIHVQESAIEKMFAVHEKGINASVVVNKVYNLKITDEDLQAAVLQKLDPLHTITTRPYCSNNGQIVRDYLDERAVHDGLVSNFIADDGSPFITFRVPCLMHIFCTNDTPEHARAILGFYEISFTRANAENGIIVHKFIRPWNKLHLNNLIDKAHLKTMDRHIRLNFKAILAAAADVDRTTVDATLREFLHWSDKNL